MAKEALSFEKFEQELEEMELVDRLVHLHHSLRNIPRKFLAEYVEIPEDKMEQLFNEDEGDDIA